MSDTKSAAAAGRSKARLPAQIRKLILWLSLLLIGILAIPTFLLTTALFELADFTIRAMDP